MYGIVEPWNIVFEDRFELQVLTTGFLLADGMHEHAVMVNYVFSSDNPDHYLA